jgi:DNA polymerase-1
VVRSVLPKGAELFFLGEAPGAEEDKVGRPFVGESGQLLNRALEEVGLDRSQIAICNAVACRSPGNIKPSPQYLRACKPWMVLEIGDLKPRLIVALGTIALGQVLPGIGQISRVRGHLFDSESYGCKVLPTFHPAYVLRKGMAGPEYGMLLHDLRVAKSFIEGQYEEPNRSEVAYYVVENRAQFDWLISNLNSEPEWAFDTETTGFNWQKDEIFIATFSWAENTAVLLDFRSDFVQQNATYVWRHLAKVLANDSRKILQNGSFDIKFFMHRGIQVNNFYADTTLMHHLLDENSKHDQGGYHHKLDAYVAQYKPDSYADVPNEIIYPYASTDADVTYRAYKAMMPKIYEQALDFVFFTITMPARRMLTLTEFTGVTVDRAHLDATLVKYEKDMAATMEQIQKQPNVLDYTNDRQKIITDAFFKKWSNSRPLQKKFLTFQSYLDSKKPKDTIFEFNVRSHLQLKELLIDRMQLKVLRFTKKNKRYTDNPSFNDEALTLYAKSHDFCRLLSEYRGMSHIKSNFLDGFIPHIKQDGRVHTDYLIFGTVTGRPSSVRPNLNNIPRTGTASEIKDIFIADPGDWMVELDQAQAEFRMWINYSRDPQAMRDLRVGHDIHRLVAAMSKGVKVPKGDVTPAQFKELVKDVTKEERQNTKEVTFGIMYGESAQGVSQQKGIPLKQAELVIYSFFARYPRAKLWLRRTRAEARANGYVMTTYGRRRRLTDITSGDLGARSGAERQAVNAPIQGGTSDIVLWAGIRVNERLLAEQWRSRLILTVYDSMIYNAPDDELERLCAFAWNEMRKPPSPAIVVNLDSEVKIGRSWGSLKAIDMTKPFAWELQRIKKELGEPTEQLFWWVHPESDSYVIDTKESMHRGGMGGELDELGPATTWDEEEAKSLQYGLSAEIL